MRYAPALACLMLSAAAAANAHERSRSLLIRVQSSLKFLEGDELSSEVLVYRDGLVLKKETFRGVANYSRSPAQARELAGLRRALADNAIGTQDGVACRSIFRPSTLHLERFEQTLTWFGMTSDQSRFRISDGLPTECASIIENLLVAFQGFSTALRDNPGNETVFTTP